MCIKAVYGFLTALKFVFDWSVTSKTIKKLLLTALYGDDSVLYFNEESGDVASYYNEMSTCSIDFNNINLGDTNSDQDDTENIIHIRILAWHVKFEKGKALKQEINKELMLIVWHPRRWWTFGMSEDQK